MTMLLGMAACALEEGHAENGNCSQETSPAHCYCCGSHLTTPETTQTIAPKVAADLSSPALLETVFITSRLQASIFNPPRA
jgi:hypothetical protein